MEATKELIESPPKGTVIANSHYDEHIAEIMKTLKQKQDDQQVRVKKMQDDFNAFVQLTNDDLRVGWKILATYLTEKGLLPSDYDPNKHTIEWDEKTGEVIVHPLPPHIVAMIKQNQDAQAAESSEESVVQ